MLLDLDTLLRTTIATLRSAALDKQRGRINVRTEHGSAGITLRKDGDHAALPVTDFAIINPRADAMLAVLNVRVNSRARAL